MLVAAGVEKRVCTVKRLKPVTTRGGRVHGPPTAWETGSRGRFPAECVLDTGLRELLSPLQGHLRSRLLGPSGRLQGNLDPWRQLPGTEVTLAPPQTVT